MSYNVYPVISYGLKGNSTELSTTTQERGCEHPIKNETDKFCSECGNPTFRNETMHISEMVSEWVRTHPLEKAKISPFDVEFVFRTLNCESEDGVLGFSAILSSDHTLIKKIFTPTPEMKAYIEEFCKHYNIQITEIDQYYFQYESY